MLNKRITAQKVTSGVIPFILYSGRNITGKKEIGLKDLTTKMHCGEILGPVGTVLYPAWCNTT
jgi:hypothetical protein